MPVMSGLRLWAPQFLFLWQLLWLQVQAAPIPELDMDSTLLTSILQGLSKPWSLDQQNPANIDASAVLVEAPSLNPQEALAQLPLQQEASTQSTMSFEPFTFLIDPHQQGVQDKHHLNPEYVQSSKSSAPPPVPVADTETSQIHKKGRHQPPKSSMDVEVQSSHHKGTDSLPDWGEDQQRLLPIGVKDVDMKTSKPPKKIAPSATSQVSAHHATSLQESSVLSTSVTDAIALKQTAAPPKHTEVTFPLQEPVQAQKPTFPPVDLGLTITPEHTLEAAATSMQQTAASPLNSSMTFPLTEPVQAQQPTFPPLELELPIIPEPTLEAGATTLQPNTAPAKHPSVAFPLQEPVQAQKPTFPPVDLGLTITPEHTYLEAAATAMQQTAASPLNVGGTFPLPETIQAQQPTFPPLELELPIILEPTLEAGATTLQPNTAPAKHPSVAFPLQEPVQAQKPTLPPVDLGLTISPEHTLGAAATAMQQTAASPLNVGGTFPLPETVQSQQPTFPPLELELPIITELTFEAGAITLQPNEAPAKHPSVSFPPPETIQGQQTTFTPFDLALTITPEPTLEADATVLQQTISPPNHSEVALQHPELVQVQQSTFSEVTVAVLSYDLEVTITQQPESSETVPPMTEQKATMNICELCSCDNGTLTCIGFGSNQRLKSVPVPEPGTYKGTFTVLNLQGNAISYIDKDSWKSYHLVEKLNLSGNNLKELRQDSFEGLFSLQYLDLSCNKIEFIERNAFESLPLLQYINLGCNLITKVSFGTFKTWHGMQLLHKLILHHNPLMTVQDPYFFNLPALKYLDLGTTQVTFTTLDDILRTTPELEKLILPKHLACCLCQFKNDIEAVAKKVKLQCDSECLTNTPCDEELLIQGPLMKILEGRRQNTNTELTIEPERASSNQNRDTSSSLMSLLMSLLTEEQKVKMPSAEWNEDQWKKETMQASAEQKEKESHELRKEVPGYKNKIIIAAPVIGVTTFFIVIFCLIVICQRKVHKSGSSSGFFSNFHNKKSSSDQDIEDGSFWRKRPLWLKDMYGGKKHKEEPSAEEELFLKMEKSKSSPSSREIDASDSADTEAESTS